MSASPAVSGSSFLFAANLGYFVASIRTAAPTASATHASASASQTLSSQRRVS